MAKKSNGSTALANNAKVNRLIERRHPEYDANAGEWLFLKQAVDGGPAYVEGNLFQHPKEDAQVFAARKARAADRHYNFTSQVLDTYQGYLFQQEPVVAADLPGCLPEFFDKADIEGRSALTFAKDVAYWMCGEGIIWVCVDKPGTQGDPNAADQQLLSAQQEIDAGLAPYAYLVFPQDVLDGKIDRGEIVWLLVREQDRDDADPMESTGAIVIRYRLWERDKRTLFTPQLDQAGNQATDARGQRLWSIETSPHPLGEVPFVAFRYYGSEGKFSCPGLITDIAHLDRGVFNKCSLQDEIHYAATFPQLSIPYEGELFEDDDTGGMTAEGKTILTMGLHTVLPFRASAGKPEYVSPPSEPSKDLGASIQQMIALGLALALLDSEVGTEHAGGSGGTHAESGVSRSYKFQKLNKRLSTIAESLESGWYKVCRLVCLWMKEDWTKLPKAPWDWPDSFEVQSLAQELEDLAAVLGGNPPSATMKAEIWKRIVRRLFPKMDETTLDDIDEDIVALASSGAGITGQGAQLAQDDLQEGPGQELKDLQQAQSFNPDSPRSDIQAGNKLVQAASGKGSQAQE